MSREGIRRRRLVCLLAVASAVMATGALAPPTASAWSISFCGWYVAGHSYCGEGSYKYLTYVSGQTDVSHPPGLCVYAVTAAANIRGGGVIPCTSGGRFVNVCYRNESPASEGRVATGSYGAKNLYGHEDNSPNHTGCY